MAGVLTQRALTWKSLCVPSGEGDTHSCSLIFLPNREQTCSSFCLFLVERILRQLLCSLFGRSNLLVSSLFVVEILIIVTVVQFVLTDSRLQFVFSQASCLCIL